MKYLIPVFLLFCSCQKDVVQPLTKVITPIAENKTVTIFGDEYKADSLLTDMKDIQGTFAENDVDIHSVFDSLVNRNGTVNDLINSIK